MWLESIFTEGVFVAAISASSAVIIALITYKQTLKKSDETAKKSAQTIADFTTKELEHRFTKLEALQFTTDERKSITEACIKINLLWNTIGSQGALSLKNPKEMDYILDQIALDLTSVQSLPEDDRNKLDKFLEDVMVNSKDALKRQNATLLHTIIHSGLSSKCSLVNPGF